MTSAPLRCLATLLVALALVPAASAGLVPYTAFAQDVIESFEGIAGPLPFPNFGVNGIRGPVPAGFTTPTGLRIENGTACYINDWAHGQANISSTGVSITSAADVIDGTAYFFTYNTVGRVRLTLPGPATRWGAHMGGNGVQNTTFDMYLGATLVDSFTTVGLTDFQNFTGWQSTATFDRIEWNGNHAGFDLFAFDNGAPSCTLTGPVGTGGDDIDFSASTASLSAVSLDLTFEHSTDGGATWSASTAAPTSALPNPALGVAVGAASFTWDSRADGVGTSALAMGVIERLTVEDSMGRIGTCQSLPFDVDNTALCTLNCGDCNLSGAAPDILDALAAAQVAAAIITPMGAQLGCCDVDGNATINILDALGTAQTAAGLPFTLRCP